MSALIALTPVTADGRSFDLTALSCEGGAWNNLQGWTGADWCAQRDGTVFVQKRQGGFQLAPELFTDGPADMPTYQYTANPSTVLNWTSGDADDPLSNPAAFTNKKGAAPATGTLTATGFGLRWTKIIATRETRQLFLPIYVSGAQGCQFTLSASLSDASYADQSLALTQSLTGSQTKIYWTQVTYSAFSNCLLTVKLKCTSGATDASVTCAWPYIGVPVPEPKARFISMNRSRL